MNTLIYNTLDVPLLDEVLEEAARLRPMWGALSAEIPSWHPRNEGDDDDDDSSDNEGDDDSSGDNDDDDDDSSDDDADRSGDDDDDGVVKVPRSEHEAMRRELAQRRRADQKAKKKKQQEERRKKAQAGQYEELLAEKDDEIAEKDAEIERLKGELTTTMSIGLINRVAKRLDIEDPELVEALYTKYEREGEDRTKEADVEAVIKRILRAKPKLRGKRAPTGGPTGGNGATGKLTYEDIQKMSQDEISRRYNEPEFQAALEAGPTT